MKEGNEIFFREVNVPRTGPVADGVRIQYTVYMSLGSQYRHSFGLMRALLLLVRIDCKQCRGISPSHVGLKKERSSP